MTTIDVSWASIWRIVAVGIVTLIAVFSWKILLGLFLAIVISSGLDFIVDWMERRGIPRSLGVIAVFVLAAAIAALVAYTVIPHIIGDLVKVVSRFDKELAQTWLAPLASSASIGSIVSKLSNQLIAGGASGFAAVASGFEPVVIFATVIVSAFYLSLSRAGIEQFIRNTLPGSMEDPVLRVYRRSRKKIGNWFRAQVLLGVIVGTIVWFCLWMVGVEQAAVFGLLAGICELVPILGPIVAGTVAVGVTIVTAPLSALWTFLIFFAIHQIESNALVPLLTRQAVGLHPVVVITALLLGYQLAGVMGTLAAVPLAAVLQEVLEEVTRRRHEAIAAAEIPMPVA
jgi:predicted PurR-regulated permease PerM